MTLIASLEGVDGIVLAGDSRGTVGDPRGLTAINDTHTKIFQLSAYCGIGISGASELANRCVDALRRVIQQKNLVDVDDIVNETYNWIKAQYQGWFGGPKPWFSAQQQGPIIDQRPKLIFIICGYNKNSNQQGRIYLITSDLDFAPQLCISGHMLAGVPQYAVYLLHRLYNRQMKLENISALAAYLITETATQDPKVGGPVRMAAITIDQGFKIFEENEIKKINEKNEGQNIKLREFFFKSDDNDKKDNR